MTWSRIACAFSSVSGGRRIALRRAASPPNPPAGHFWTWNVCAPRTLISRSIAPWITEIPVITAMIDATPATIPTSVSTERSLLATIAWSDIARTSGTRMRSPPAARAYS